MRGVCVLGSTGTIGENTLDVIARHPERFRVVALTARRNVRKLAQQCVRFRPNYAVVLDADPAPELEDCLRQAGVGTEVLVGAHALAEVAALPEVDDVMAAIVGSAGLLPTMAGVQAGKRVLLANKEALVMGGALFMAEVKRSGASLLPIDSEHNAIFQCLPMNADVGLDRRQIKRILITGSGGPFRTASAEQMRAATPDQACAHPKWVMGRKISVDSATLMNKGLEVIEAHWLFGFKPDQIEVVIHPQSIVHSMVEFIDGSVLAQLSNPDMRIPIAYGLSWPERIESGVSALDLFSAGTLEFLPPEPERFPCLALAMQAVRAEAGAAVVLNAANEIAVAAFLERQIGFVDIAAVIARSLDRLGAPAMTSLERVLELDAQARNIALGEVKRLVA